MSISKFPTNRMPVEYILGRTGYQIRPRETDKDRKIRKVFSQMNLINEQNISLEEKIRQARKSKLPKSFYFATQRFYFTFYESTGYIGYTPDSARSSFLS